MWMEILMLLSRPESELDGLNSGSWYHWLSIIIIIIIIQHLYSVLEVL